MAAREEVLVGLDEPAGRPEAPGPHDRPGDQEGPGAALVGHHGVLVQRPAVAENQGVSAIQRMTYGHSSRPRGSAQANLNFPLPEPLTLVREDVRNVPTSG